MSISARLTFSVFANVLKAVITFGTGMIVARSLGPEQYGVMMFLIGTFSATRQLLDMGSSTAFFTFLSQRQRSRNFVALYLAWLGVQFLVPLLVVGVFTPSAWVEIIWQGEQRSLVVLAFIAAFTQSVLWSTFLQMGESQRLTRLVQGIAVLVALVHCLLVVLAWYFECVSVKGIFILLILEWGIAVVVVANNLHFPQITDIFDTSKQMFKEFWRYCLPLIPYAWLGFAYEFADRWLLQTYAGSVQQAYYSVAFQFGAITTIATSSVLNIFWKEVAELYHQKDFERINKLYLQVSRRLFFLAAMGAGFLAPWSSEILHLTLGSVYEDGSVTLMVMFFYPLHQAIGQVGGVMAYATGRVTAYVRLGMLFMTTSIVVTYFILGPRVGFFPGFELGSVGLAIKMVFMQIISVNALAFYLSRSLRVGFDWFFQCVSVLACVAAGLLTYILVSFLFDLTSQIWIPLLVACFLYILIVISLITIFPGIAGLSRNEINSLMTIKFRLVR